MPLTSCLFHEFLKECMAQSRKLYPPKFKQAGGYVTLRAIKYKLFIIIKQCGVVFYGLDIPKCKDRSAAICTYLQLCMVRGMV